VGVISLAILLRIMRRWNQTGQKFAAEPDIAHNILPQHQNVLWTLLCLSYLGTYRQITMDLPFSDFTPRALWRITAAVVTTLAFTFKLAFTAADSPELLSNSLALREFGKALGSFSLILQARLVFFGIATMMVVALYTVKTVPSMRKKGNPNVKLSKAKNGNGNEG
jgi:ethanolamine phosphate transferase 2 subunit G